MRIYKLPFIAIVRGSKAGLKIPLDTEFLTLGRADETSEWKPDIDLTPDFKVSRNHARLFFKNKSWWLEDSGSKHGTWVDGKGIDKSDGPVEMVSGTTVKMGETVWVFFLPDDVHLNLGGLSLSFQRNKAVNYAIYHCGIPIIKNLMVRNHGDCASMPFSLSFVIKGYSRPSQTHFDALSPGEVIQLPKIHLDLNYEKLEGNEGRKRAELEVRWNDDPIFNEEISVLGFFEWPTDRAYRKSLACFVQPAHPVVQNLVLDAADYIQPESIPSFFHLLKSDLPDRADHAVGAVYECLKHKYSIHYVLESPSFEKDSQVIRPPHRIISEGAKFKGEGTCIDLTLLMASCLENLRFQPLLIFVKDEGLNQHVFLGCWNQRSHRVVPIINDFAKIGTDRISMVETTGLTDRWANKLEYDEAVSRVHAQLNQENFLFAVDIAATRIDVVPIQFPMDPGVLRVLHKAEELARKKRHPRLETQHLLLSILGDSGNKLKAVIEKAGGDLSRLALNRIEKNLLLNSQAREERLTPRPTINYRRLIEDARLIAGDAGFQFAQRPHLFYALLLSQSESVDITLREMGTNRQAVRQEFVREYPWTMEVVQTIFEKE